MEGIGVRARAASQVLSVAPSKNRDLALSNIANKLVDKKSEILAANEEDRKATCESSLDEAYLGRLILSSEQIDSMAVDVNKIAALPDPVGEYLDLYTVPNGLEVGKRRVPLGVIGAIYESRPNVTVDISVVCLKSGNAVILKGGSEAIHTNKILAKLFRKALKENKVNENFIQFISTKNRKMVDYMLSKMTGYIDVIIPRGGKNLVKRVQSFSKVPIIGHLEGLCHTYIDKDAELKMATNIIYNAKLRNTSICGATETILLHKKIAKKFCNPILKKLEENNCKIYGDHILKKYYKGKLYPAKEKDWSTEYLSATISVKCVKNCDEAINHINKYGTMHTDSIITKNKQTAKKFLKNVKSSIAMHNTSTQFADGGEFGFGGEVGISTSTLPPRGPVGLGQLISYKYEITSKGQTRK